MSAHRVAVMSCIRETHVRYRLMAEIDARGSSCMGDSIDAASQHHTVYTVFASVSSATGPL